MKSLASLAFLAPPPISPTLLIPWAPTPEALTIGTPNPFTLISPTPTRYTTTSLCIFTKKKSRE